MRARLTIYPLSALLAGLALAVPAHAQDEAPVAGAAGGAGDAPLAKPRTGGHGRLKVTPYIEAEQVLTSELSPGSETLTYTRVAAGVDAAINGRNTSGAVSLRYEHRFGWDKNAEDGDTLSGLARVSAAIIPRTLTVEAGGMAARTRLDGGGAFLGGIGDNDEVGHFYSAYAGPSLTTRVGDVGVNASYRLGYSRVDTSGGDIFSSTGDDADDSIQHAAQFRAGVKPGDVLPVGLGVGAAWYREDISNFDQRIDDFHVRGDVTLPVSQTVALVGGVGYERVKSSQRDVVRDGAGRPVIDDDGHYRLDKDAPRQIAYDVDGLIWDVGLLWRPSPRTSLEAHMGRRYGSATYYGSFSWQASRRSSVNVSVYDSMSGFGGQLNRSLVSLPTDFEAIRDPVSGELNGCVGSLKEGSCLTGALGGLRSAIFRARGISASYAVDMGRISTGVGIGYERRKYVAPRESVLGLIDGVTEKNLWLSAYMRAMLDERSSVTTNFYINRYYSGLELVGDSTSFGASAAYYRMLTRRLSARAAVGIDGNTRQDDDDYWTATALVGMQYAF